MPPSPLSHAVPRAPPPQVQLHLVEMIKAKKSGAGHKMYKVCRLVLANPIVEEDTYCREVTARARPNDDAARPCPRARVRMPRWPRGIVRPCVARHACCSRSCPRPSRRREIPATQAW